MLHFDVKSTVVLYRLELLYSLYSRLFNASTSEVIVIKLQQNLK